MFIGKKTVVLFMLLTLIVLTTGCSRNYDFNPTTTIVRMIYDSSKKVD